MNPLHSAITPRPRSTSSGGALAGKPNAAKPPPLCIRRARPRHTSCNSHVLLPRGKPRNHLLHHRILPPLLPLPLTPPVDLTRLNVPPALEPPPVSFTPHPTPARSHPANSPTFQQVGKSESRKVGTHHHPPRTGEPPRIVVSSSHPLPPPYPRVNRAAPCILHPPPAAHSTTPYRG